MFVKENKIPKFSLHYLLITHKFLKDFFKQMFFIDFTDKNGNENHEISKLRALSDHFKFLLLNKCYDSFIILQTVMFLCRIKN